MDRRAANVETLSRILNTYIATAADGAQATVYANSADIAARKGGRALGVAREEISLVRTHVRGRAV